MITSISNDQIKKLIRLMKKSSFRWQEGLFVAEGVRLAAEAIELGLVERLYVTEDGLVQLEARFGKKIDCPYEVVADQIFAGIADTVSPQGVAALVRMPLYRSNQFKTEQMKSKRDQRKQSQIALEDILRIESANVLFLEEVRDPGNLGTIIRTAECAGVTGIVLSSGCADIYNPKVVRATMGSLFRVPFVYVDNIVAAILCAKKNHIRVFGTHLNGRQNFYEEDYAGKTAFLIGNEANGITEETARAADALVKIPMAGRAESLNASVAAAVVIYEAYRQKHIHK